MARHCARLWESTGEQGDSCCLQPALHMQQFQVHVLLSGISSPRPLGSVLGAQPKDKMWETPA